MTMTGSFYNLVSLRERITAFATTPPEVELEEEDAEKAVLALIGALERGEVRAAERGADGVWRAVAWVKQGILLGFRMGRMTDMSLGGKSSFRFFDKHLFPTQPIQASQGVRIVPGGSTIRRGAYVAKGVVCMPPMYINVGAWVGRGTMVDSHALVGSCAQVGERVHLSAASQLGGVLEPVNATPVVIEDDAFIGGNCGIYEGTIVRRRAVIASGVILTRGTPVYDVVRETVYRAAGDRSLEIPEGAVVVPGARRLGGAFADAHELSVQTPLIVKYRDDGTDAATALEQWLR